MNTGLFALVVLFCGGLGFFGCVFFVGFVWFSPF